MLAVIVVGCRWQPLLEKTPKKFPRNTNCNPNPNCKF